MKLVGMISTAVLSLVLGAAAPAFAQQDEHSQQDEKHAQQDDKKTQQDKLEQKDQKSAQQEEKQAQHDEHQAQQENKHEPQQNAQHEMDAKSAQQNEKHEKQDNQHSQQQPGHNEQAQRTPEQQHVQQTAWKEHSSQHWDSDHRTWQQRGGYHGYRIPDDHFRVYFGREHEFRIYGLPFLVVGGYPRFQYSGYWLSPVDPWPGYWAADWYDTDDVYVVYVDNGYYLYNRRYPNVGIAINISL